MNKPHNSKQQLQEALAKAEARIAELELRQQRAEESLARTKKNTERYLDLAEVILVALDDQARVTMVGGQCQQVLGYESGELIGKNWIKVCLPPEDQENMHSVFRKVMSGDEVNVEYYENDVVTKYGYILHVAWHNSPLLDKDGHVIGTLSAGIDITERKQAENILIQKEAQFRSIIDASPVPYALNDDQQNIVYLNPAFVRTFGYTLDDIPTLDDWWPRAYPDPDYLQWVKNTWQQHLQAAERDRTPFEHLEVNICCKDGSHRTVLASAAILAESYRGNHLVILYDITERKNVEHSLAASEERFRTMVENVPGVSFRCKSDKHWSMEFISGEIGNLSGYPDTDFIQNKVRSYASIIHSDDKQRVKSAILDGIRSKQPFTIEYRIVRADGAIRWVFAKGQGVFGDAGDVMWIDGVILDITEPKRAESALRKSEQKYRQLFENMTSGFALHEIICDEQGVPVDYRYLELNPAFTKLTGVPSSALLGKTIREVMPDTEDYWIEIFGKVALTGESIAYENYSRELGKYYDTWVFSPQKNQFAVIFTDVTERKIAEDALKEGDRYFRALFEQSSFGVAKIDSQTGRFVKINRRYCELIGYTHDEMLNLDFQSVTFPADLKNDLYNLQQLRDGKISKFQSEKRYRRKDGAIVWVNLSVLPLWEKGDPPDFHLAIVEDITKRKVAEENLQRQKNEQQQIVNTMVDAVITIDEQAVIQTFNTSAESMFGYGSGEVVGKKINILMPDDYARQHDSYLSRYLKTNEAHIIGSPREVAGRRKNGEEFPLRLSVAELPQTANGSRRFIGSCQDITDYKQQEEQLRRSQKMDALGKLTGGIAHDYNNTLGIILGFSELLQDEVGNDPVLTKYVSAIKHASERGASLSKKLLTFSRYKQSEADVVNINALIKTESDILQKTLTPSILLELDLCQDIWPVFVDSNDLEDAILNMAINAMHAMQLGGTLVIRTKNIHFGERDVVNNKLAAGDYVELSISDTGSGMDADILAKIFDPFYTTKGDGGVGLGLSMVYGFVKRSGGDIVVDSIPGQGSRFHMYFPKYTQAVPIAPTKKPVINEVAFRGDEIILVVDDEPAMLELVARMLSSRGYRVLVADSAKKALAMLENEKIDLLLSDIVMPDMDGYQLAAVVNQMYPKTKVQFMSGYARDRWENKETGNVAGTLLEKPFTSQALLRRVREVLDGKKLTVSAHKPRIMIMDDEENVRELFRINLEKLGYDAVLAANGEQAVSYYQRSLQDKIPIDAVIMDVSIHGGMDGKVAAEKILAIDKNAKLIVSSGDTYGSVMKNYSDYGFKNAIEKNFDRNKMAHVIWETLSSG